MVSTWSGVSRAQVLPPSDTLRPPRVKAAAIGIGTGYVASMVGLNELWYKDHPRSAFHFFDDSGQWLQMDKAGHALTGYQISRFSDDLFRWSGLSPRESALWGGGVGLFFLTGVEVFDGFSEQWGFSPTDAAANAAGVLLYVGQELAFREQRMLLKFSYTPTDLAEWRPEILGSTPTQRVLKDYNGQRVWLTVMPRSFGIVGDSWPRWLGLSFGYGAGGMLGGIDNPTANRAGTELPAYNRYRRGFLSLDIDLTRIPTRSQFLRSVFAVLGFVKFPAPALEWSRGQLTGHWLFF